MRIAFFVHSFPELSETFILRQVTGLIDRGHEVRIFAYTVGTDGAAHHAVEEYGLRRLVRVLPRPHGKAELPAIRARGQHVGLPRSVRASMAALNCMRPEYARTMGGWRTLVRNLATLCIEEPFDIVHCHYGDIGLRYRAAARLWRAPLVVSFYGYDSSSYPLSHGSRVFEPLFTAADAVTSLSRHMDARLGELGCPEILLRRMPLAVDPADCWPAERPPRRVGAPVRVLTIARLTEKKGVEFALRALALVVQEFPQVTYDVIGSGPLLPDLEALAGSLGVQAHVRFLGAQTSDQVTRALRGADLFVLASVTARNGDQEGTPTAILEAAYCRLPVVSTLHAGIPELVLDGDSGYLVPERDYEALADRLRTLLRSPERWPAMGEAGHRHVQSNHTIGAVAERLESLYQEVQVSRRGDRLLLRR